ncbi:MAG: glycosyltransferase family 4 protein [Patescibacteria group bacterium]|nr:glycosyltransferase family 4 protein [Patescibacteria group bacterium]
MPKILYFITQSEFGGAQRYVFDLANNLKVDFKVAVAIGEQRSNGTLAKILQENNIEFFTIPHLKRNISPFNDILALAGIIKLIKNYQPDIVHLNSSKISILGSIASLFVKTKTVYTVHGWVFNEPLAAWLKYFYLGAEKLTAGLKNKIICVSEYDKRVALKYKIEAEDKLVTIHNGLAPIKFYAKEEARQKIYSVIPASEPESSVQRHEQVSKLLIKPAMTSNLLVGSIGNLYKTKGFEYLIKTADILVSNHLPITFLVIGQGSERKNLEGLIEKYNLKNNFILAGHIDEASKLLPAFDIYVCPSVKEGLPYSILEAMSAGLPIVSTDVGGITEIITDKKTGLLVQPANIKNLADTLQKLINDKKLQIELSKNAKQSVDQNFDLEKMVAATKKIYLSFLEK